MALGVRHLDELDVGGLAVDPPKLDAVAASLDLRDIGQIVREQVDGVLDGLWVGAL